MEKKQRTYEVSNICAAVVATVAIVGVVVASYAQYSKLGGKDSLTDWLMFFVSAGALLVSVAAFVYLKRTFEATREQVNVSQIAYNTAIENHRYANRPILKVLRDPDADFYFSDNGRVEKLKFNVSNIVKSSARSIGVRSVTVSTQLRNVKQQFVMFLNDAQRFPNNSNVFSDILQGEDAGVVIELS